MRIRWYFAVMCLVAAGLVYGQQVKDGAPTVLLASATYSSTETNSTSVLLKSYDSVCATITVTGTNAVDVALIRPQWSSDNTTWYDEPIFNTGTVSGTDTRYSYTSKVIIVPMNVTTKPYIERSRRLAKYLRYSVASTNATTIATLKIEVLEENNNN